MNINEAFGYMESTGEEMMVEITTREKCKVDNFGRLRIWDEEHKYWVIFDRKPDEVVFKKIS